MNNAVHFKISPPQLERQAFIYIRQSTLVQVRDNTASTTRQYQLIERAHALGWPAERITVIDQDQGHSGASARGRVGFERLIAEVGLGRCRLQFGSLAPSPFLQRLVSVVGDLRSVRHAGHRRGRHL